jgi:hypothetical protein
MILDDYALEVYNAKGEFIVVLSEDGSELYLRNSQPGYGASGNMAASRTITVDGRPARFTDENDCFGFYPAAAICFRPFEFTD